jgi:hypothetical protein
LFLIAAMARHGAIAKSVVRELALVLPSLDVVRFVESCEVENAVALEWRCGVGPPLGLRPPCSRNRVVLDAAGGSIGQRNRRDHWTCRL